MARLEAHGFKASANLTLHEGAPNAGYERPFEIVELLRALQSKQP